MGQKTAQKKPLRHLLKRFFFWSGKKSVRSPIVYRALRMILVVDAPAAACQQPLLVRAKAVGRMVTRYTSEHQRHHQPAHQTSLTSHMCGMCRMMTCLSVSSTAASPSSGCMRHVTTVPGGQSKRICTCTNIATVAPSSPHEAKESLRSGTNMRKKGCA